MRPDEVLGAARTRVRGLGIATVYRNLKLLADAGWLSPVDLPGEATRYEVAGKPHHHHFLCRQCHRAYELEDCPGKHPARAPAGFRIEAHEIVLYGLCHTCAG